VTLPLFPFHIIREFWSPVATEGVPAPCLWCKPLNPSDLRITTAYAMLFFPTLSTAFSGNRPGRQGPDQKTMPNFTTLKPPTSGTPILTKEQSSSGCPTIRIVPFIGRWHGSGYLARQPSPRVSTLPCQKAAAGRPLRGSSSRVFP